jgi:hypothetical protein
MGAASLTAPQDREREIAFQFDQREASLAATVADFSFIHAADKRAMSTTSRRLEKASLRAI